MFGILQLKGLTIETPVFAAPLAGVTDLPYRRILRSVSPNLPILTEMNSCHSLIQNARTPRNSDDFLVEGLIGAQIFGANIDAMREGAKILESRGAKWIDINMGCPVPKVATRALAGANLMRDHALAGKIVAAIAGAVKIPVSIKTRLGWDATQMNSAELVRIAADNGAAFATIHGRTRSQGYAGVADWSGIAAIKATSPIPIIANGDIKNADDAASAQEISNCDGVMVGRALLGNPFVLNKIANPAAKSVLTADIILRHLEYSLEYYGARSGLYMFRKHLSWYAAGRPGAAEFRAKINKIESVPALRIEIENFFN